MNILVWNIRGMRASLPRLKHLITEQRLHLLALLEPKHTPSSICRFMLQLGFTHSYASNSHRIWFFWRDAEFQLLATQDQGQVVHFTLQSITLQWKFVFSVVYANTTPIQRRPLWQALSDFACSCTLPWLVGGDFNTFRALADHHGRSVPSLAALQDFNDCIEQCSLMDPPHQGSRFTWADGRGLGRICRRLDWLFINSTFQDSFTSLQLSHLPRVASDHMPILFLCRRQGGPIRRTFRFLDPWLHHSDFHNYMKQAWLSYPTTGGMYGFYNKLRSFKKDIQRWNIDIFGNIFNNLKYAETQLNHAEAALDAQPTEEHRVAYHKAKAEYLQASAAELRFWKQKDRVKWLQEGDANTQYFHSIVKGKRTKLRIQQIHDAEGHLLTEPSDIMTAAVSFYKDLFAPAATQNHAAILSYIPRLVSDEDNTRLTMLPTASEIKDAVWHLDPHSAAGPDGFHGMFYRSCWSVIHSDVEKAVQEFFLGIPQPSIMASAFITLIPKTSSPQSFSDFRPICLTNFLSKVCTRIIATRLGLLLPKLISPEQTGFLPGYDISTQVLLAREMVHMMDNGTSHLCLKLDMMKAFDRVSWDYLERLLLSFGFSGFFTRLILNHLRATTLSVLINGEPSPSFRPYRGVKQGDPLSPLLFILSSEGFSHGLSSLVTAGNIQSFGLGRIPFAISHLAYADDLLVFLQGTQRNIRRFKRFLTDYETASGQKVNFQKSSMIPSDRLSVRRVRDLQEILGMRLSTLPFRYLGSYLHKGINRSRYCATLLQHFDDKLQGWHSRLLSSAGRLVLLRSVISALPLHVMAAGGLPKSVIKMIHRKMATFYWGNRHHWVAWSNITLPTEEGGLGLRDLNSLQQAYHCRIWWLYHKQDTLWSRYMHAKYGRRGDFRPRLPDSPVWKLICRINHLCVTHTAGTNNFLTWQPSTSGEFALKSAYNIRRPSRPTLLSAKFIWFKHHSPSIRLLLWRLFHAALPFEDYIGSYLTARPTQCPFCKQYSSSVDHVFLYCSTIQPLWMFFAAELQGISPTTLPLRQYLLAWWYRSSSSSFDGVLKIVVPGILVYNIWRCYANMVYGDQTSFSISALRNTVHFDIHMWVHTLQGTKLAAGPATPLSWLPTPRPSRLQVIKWLTPPSGRFKLNVDAAVGRFNTAGGIILRDSCGTCVRAVAFRLPSCPPLQAEIQAALFGLLYFLPLYRSLIIETDCAQLLQRLRQQQPVFGNFHLKLLQLLITRHNLEIQHVFREANMPAHYLAQHAMLSPCTSFFTSSSLPSMVRAAVSLDLTSATLRRQST